MDRRCSKQQHINVDLYICEIGDQKPENYQSMEAIKKRRNELIHDNMQINYKQDPGSGKISKVKLKTKKLEDINIVVSDIRQKIINEISKITVKATAYNAVKEQTDSDPNITACLITASLLF